MTDSNSLALKDIALTLNVIKVEMTSQGTRLEALQVDVSQLKTAFGGLQDSVVGLNKTVGGLQHTVGNLQESFAHLSKKVGGIHESVGGLNKTVGGLQNSVGDLHNRVGGLTASVYRLEVLNEDFDERMKADAELLRANLNVRDQVIDHETRLDEVESLQTILKDTVRDHSRKLKSR